MKVPASVLKRAKGVRLLAMDVDGVLTAGEVIVLDSGEEVKIWSVKDRMGFYMLKRAELPIKMAWITARKSMQVETRAKEIGVDYLAQASLDKWTTLQGFASDMGVKPSQVAYIGDDMVDLRPLSHVGLAICPPDSAEAVRKVCHYQTRTPGGKGAVREVIELVLRAQGAWDKVLKIFSTFLLMVAAGLALSACTGTVPQTTSVEHPDQWIEKFTITETDRGLPVWVLNSETAQVYNARKTATLDNIRLQFMNGPEQKRKVVKDLARAKKSQTLAAYLSSPKGEVRLDTHDLSAWGGVEVRAQDGTILYTEKLSFSSARRKILSDSPVKVVRADSIVLGEGLEADPDLSTVKILRHEATIHPKKLKSQ